MTQGELKELLKSAAVVTSEFYDSCIEAKIELKEKAGIAFEKQPIELQTGHIVLAGAYKMFKNVAELVLEDGEGADVQFSNEDLEKLIEFAYLEMCRVRDRAYEIHQTLQDKVDDAALNLQYVAIQELTAKLADAVGLAF